MKFLFNLLGIVLVLALMVLVSYNRKAIDKKQVLKALLAQVVMAAIIIKVPAGRAVISTVSDAIAKVLNYGSEGIQFVFGSLGLASSPTGFIFAFQTLGNIVFISGLVLSLIHI